MWLLNSSSNRFVWRERRQAGLVARSWKRAVGAGARHRLVFVDRLLASLVHLRHGAAQSVGRPSDARTGTSSSPARTSRTPSKPRSTPIGKGGCCSAAQPSPAQPRPAGQLRDLTHAHPLGLIKPSAAPLGDPRRPRLPRPGSTDGRPRRDATAPQVQEEPAGLLRRNPRAPAQGPCLTPYPRRARHRTPQKPAGPHPSPRPTRTHERHRPNRRRLLAHQQTADLGPKSTTLKPRTAEPRRLTANHARAR